MAKICLSSDCSRFVYGQQAYCRRCLAELADLGPVEELDPNKVPREHIGSCGTCSKLTYSLMFTREQAETYRKAGMQCGWCGSEQYAIEELAHVVSSSRT